jgi:hypothetical protein
MPGAGESISVATSFHLVDGTFFFLKPLIIAYTAIAGTIGNTELCCGEQLRLSKIYYIL